MAWVTARTWHPEPSVALPRLHDDLTRDMGARLTPQGDFPTGWPIGSWAFPRDVPRPVPTWVALWIAAVRRRPSAWFDVRLEPGEWREVYPAAAYLVSWWDKPELIRSFAEDDEDEPEAARLRYALYRLYRRRCLRRLALGVKARHFLDLWPDHAEAFVRGCRGPYTVMNTAGYEARYDAVLSPDPLRERTP